LLHRDAPRLETGGATTVERVSYPGLVRDHEDAIEGLRLAARPDRPAPAAMEPYLEKVRRGAYRVTDGDVDELRAAGFSEDEIFEHTVSAAVSEGLVRLDAGLRTLG
jgi:alkylhydroperoxidase family enzyme